MKGFNSLKKIGLAASLMFSCAAASENLPVLAVYSVGSAGNHLENQAGNNYNPKNMVDGNVKTAWALPYHSGEVILQFNLKKQAKVVDRIVIHNGYQKSEKRFFQNSRARKIGIYVNGIEKKNLVREWALANMMGPQQVLLGAKDVDAIFIRVHSVYPGSAWPDLCVSEVKLEGTSSNKNAQEFEPEDWDQAMDGRLDIAQQQNLALNPDQAEQMSKNHYFVLTDEQKKRLHKDWDRDTLSIIPSNWYDCSCGMYSVDWFHKDSVHIYPVEMPSIKTADASGSEEDDGPEREFGPYSSGLIMGIDGLLYEKGIPVSIDKLIEKQKAEKEEIVYERSFGCKDYGYSIDLPPTDVVGAKTLEKYKKNLIKSGLKFCEMNDE